VHYLGRIFDNRRSDSLATQMRQRRFALFRSLLEPLPRPLRILDVGGVQAFWELMGFVGQNEFEIVLLNLATEHLNYANFRSVAGDARDLSDFADNEFDVVFSNSVIEHLGDFAGQQRMASEVQRVARRYFIQTPNRHFPLEPHFLFPWFQFLPRSLQVSMVQHFDMGWYRRQPEVQAATALVVEHRLLTEDELRRLFPTAELYHERFLGLTKSFVAYGGWGQAGS
jgi:hypothetical protein